MAIGSDAAMTVAFFAAVASLAWSAAFAWSKWLARPQPLVTPMGDAEQRLARLEGAVDAIAVEVERIGEAQRFATRLLDERLPPPRPPVLPVRGERVGQITPH